MDKPGQQEYITDAYDLGGFLSEIGRRVALRGEMLRGMAKLMEEYDSLEAGEFLNTAGIELGQLGQQLKLIRDHLCHRCEMLKVEERTHISSPDENKAGQPQK